MNEQIMHKRMHGSNLGYENSKLRCHYHPC